MKGKIKTKKITALQVLSEMDKIRRELKSPSIPKHYIVGQKYTDKSANGLTKAIIAFVNFSGGQAERINNMGRMVDRTRIVTNTIGQHMKIGSVEWQKGTGRKGTADISAIVDGRSLKIEVKIGRDRQSNEQKEYELEVIQAGGIYLIAKEFTSFVKSYLEIFGRSKIFNSAITRLIEK